MLPLSGLRGAFGRVWFAGKGHPRAGAADKADEERASGYRSKRQWRQKKSSIEIVCRKINRSRDSRFMMTGIPSVIMKSGAKTDFGWYLNMLAGGCSLPLSLCRLSPGLLQEFSKFRPYSALSWPMSVLVVFFICAERIGGICTLPSPRKTGGWRMGLQADLKPSLFAKKGGGRG